MHETPDIQNHAGIKKEPAVQMTDTSTALQDRGFLEAACAPSAQIWQWQNLTNPGKLILHEEIDPEPDNVTFK